MNKRFITILVAVGVVVLGGLVYTLSRGGGTSSQAKLSVSVTQSSDHSKFVVLQKGKTLAELDNPDKEAGQAKVVRETEKDVFVGVVPLGIGGYILFDPGFYKVYQINLDTKQIQTLSHGSAALQDVSADGKWAAWISYDPPRGVIVQNLQDKTEKSYPIADHLGQFGDAHFSPDSKQLVYAAARGFPGREAGELYVIDLEKGQASFKTKTNKPDVYLTIKGWKDDGTIDYAEKNPNSEEMK